LLCSSRVKKRGALLLLLALPLTVPTAGLAESSAISAPTERHLVLLGAARDLVERVGDSVWPGWGSEGFELLLVDGEREHLIGRRRVPAGFEPAGGEPGAGMASRDRVFPPGMLATMAPFGLPATIVIGTPEATGLRPAEWILVLLHEHFHQWQMRDAAYFAETSALDLAAGDTTGRWMLEYPFPYDEGQVAAELEDLSRRLAVILRRPADVDVTEAADDLWLRWRQLLARLPPAHARYARFQVWQEGVARFVELRLAEEAAAGWTPPPALVAQPGFEDLGVAACAAWERLFEHLEAPDLAARRRVSFYALGAGLALLLDRTEPDWKTRYELPRFALGPATAD
jgi:hypothetical protein